ncbi:MAG: hypothetical protein ACLSB9_15270 [Hydrogeniiclostridium mannosilyticum]
MKKYSIGVDFGTLSGRALLVEVADRRELLCRLRISARGSGRSPALRQKLGHDWAPQHPRDYGGPEHTIPAVLRESGPTQRMWLVSARFTACTMVPVKRMAHPVPLPEFEENPMPGLSSGSTMRAAAANRLNEIAAARGALAWQLRRQNFLRGLSEAVAGLEEAPEVYQAMDRWIEAAD